MAVIIEKTVGPGRRVLVSGDIHGQLEYFKALLDEVKFSDDDILVLVGDYIERGPRSLASLRFVMELSKRENVFLLQGNMDIQRLWSIYGINEETAEAFLSLILKVRKRHGTCFFDEMCEEIGLYCNTLEEILEAKPKILENFKAEFDFIQSLPTVLETENFIFVHGGLKEKNAADNAKYEAYELQRFNAFYNSEIVFDKYVVVGHMPVQIQSEVRIFCNPIFDNNKKIISIDGGCAIMPFGQLNMLIIPDVSCSPEEITFVYCDNLEKCRALCNQEESREHVYVHWYSPTEIVETGEEFTQIRHLTTGRKLWVPSSIIESDRIDDCTDYILPVRENDTLSIVLETSKGILAKKDGFVGWYYGEYSKTL